MTAQCRPMIIASKKHQRRGGEGVGPGLPPSDQERPIHQVRQNELRSDEGLEIVGCEGPTPLQIYQSTAEASRNGLEREQDGPVAGSPLQMVSDDDHDADGILRPSSS